MTRQTDKAAAVQRVVDEFRDRPIEWGRYDCARMVVPVLRDRGHKPGLSRAGFYKSEAAAYRGMRKAGYDDLAAWMDDIGLMRIPPAATVVGDVIAFPAEEPWTWALSLALGNGRVLAVAAREGVFRVLQPDYRQLGEKYAPIAWRT